MADDWLMSYERMRNLGTMANPDQAALSADYHPPWWWGTTPADRVSGQADAVPFGNLADPVSQGAFLFGPALLRGARGLMAPAGQLRAPVRWNAFASERGNLGPAPQNVSGKALPDSVVRDAQGSLTPLYHGTPRAFEDFTLSKVDSGALYGPGIYMTENPQVAEGYALQGWPDAARDALRRLEISQRAGDNYANRLAQAQTPELIAYYQRLTDKARSLEANAQAQLDGQMRRMPELFQDNPNIRPVYVDLRRPFDIDASLSLEQAQALVPPDHNPALLAQYGDEQWTGKKMYNYLEGRLGNKKAVNAYLEQMGFDGITHIGGGRGSEHQVYIAFSPTQVYPHYTVDMLKQQGIR